MGHAEPVTTDWQVAHVMAGWLPTEAEPEPGFSEGIHWISKEVASWLGISVFQITARLKGMEGRKLVEHRGEYWTLTPTGFNLGSGTEPPKKERAPLGERVYRTPTGGLYTPGAAVATLPDDSGVKRVDSLPFPDWFMRYEWIHGDYRIDVFYDPEMQEWVKCHPTEDAELIVTHVKYPGLQVTRLRRRDGSTRADRIIARARAEE